jgi:PAS domain S-box-containing protein
VDFINQRFLEFTGRSREELLGWGWGSVVHNDDLPRYVNQWHAAVAAGEPLESEARVRRADGDYRWLLIRNVPLRDESGNIVNWYGTAIDIEERHRAEDALRRSEAYLHDAQRAGHTGSWRHDVLSGVVTISPEARRIWALNPDQDASVTEFFFGRMHPEDRPVVEQEYRAAQLKKAEFQSDFRIVLPDGAVKNIHSVGHPILNQSGDIVEFVGAAMDVTERKRAEEALRQAQADLAHVSRVTTMGELVASIAHEVNQPLGAIVTNGSACLRLLSRDTPDLDKSREIISRMIKDGMRASEVIKRVRELLHKAPSEKTPLNINETVQEVIDLVNSDLRRSKVGLLIELAADLPPVTGDRIQLQQVILNMILNAKDAMSEVHTHPREVVITTLKNESSGVVVAVQDSGKGLDPKDAESIFDPFFTTKADGMGLGLSISQRIIEDHGGRMWAIPNKPQGAVFQFTLPSENDSI